MKRRNLLIVILATAMLFLLSGCGYFSRTQASDGRFPSEVPEGQDYSGSEGSFLASQETPTTVYRRLFEEAVAQDGYTGTYLEFLEELGVGYANGAGVQEALRSVVSIECAYNTAGARVYSRGSGVIYSLDTAAGDAYIVTNYHVVYTSNGSGKETIPYISDNIHVWLYGAEGTDDYAESRAMSATYIGGAMDYDIAVLRVRGAEQLRKTDDHPVYAKSLVACDSDSLTVGETVYAIGNAAWRGMTVTDGIVSKVNDVISVAAANDLENLSLPEIRTTAPINQGNSGGGLFNIGGELVGIVNARTETEGVQGMGYAIPANLALSIAQSILDNAQIGSTHTATTGRLGINYQVTDMQGVYDETTGKYYTEQKIVVSQVTRGRLASRAGVQVRDTLYSAKLSSTRNGTPYEREVLLRNEYQLIALLFNARLGDELELRVLRGGELVTLSATFSENSDFESYS